MCGPDGFVRTRHSCDMRNQSIPFGQRVVIEGPGHVSFGHHVLIKEHPQVMLESDLVMAEQIHVL